jgi:hypothetical protein
MSDPMYPSEVYSASQNGTKLSNWLGELNIEQINAGEVLFPSGQVLACDPLTIYQLDPFDQPIPSGRHSVQLSIAHITRNSDQRIATAFLLFTKDMPVTWKMATTSGQDVNTLGDDEYFGYGVDSGVGGFMDPKAGDLLAKRYAEDDQFFDHIINLMRKTYVSTREWAKIVLDESTGLDFMVFSSGFGDGVYASYWGYSESGEVACLMTDFGILVRHE